MHKAIWFGAAASLLFACGGANDSGDIEGESQTAVSGALSVTAHASADSYVTTYDNAPRGDHDTVRVGGGSLAQATYLKFEVTGVPAGATNVHATLKVHASTTSADAVEAHLASSNAWDEATLSLANAPGPRPAVLARISGTTAGAWSSFDVSSALSGGGTFSFVLSAPTGAIVDFASKEAGAATAPTLVVTYGGPKTLFGAGYDPHTDARHDDLASQWGGMQAVRSYDGGHGVAPFLNTFQAEDVGNGAASSYSFKYPPSEVVALKHDAELRQFFQGIVDNHPVYWTYWHEPDDEIFKTHTFTAPAYRAAWAHIKQIANEVKATRPKMVAHATLIIMEYSMTDAVAPGRPLEGPNGMYPGDDVIDVFGVDVYNSPADKGGIRDAAQVFAPVMAFAQKHGKPWAIGELGSCPVAGNPGGRASFLSNALSYWKAHQAPVFVTYFDLDWPACDYRLDGDPAATKVWHDAVTSGYTKF